MTRATLSRRAFGGLVLGGALTGVSTAGVVPARADALPAEIRFGDVGFGFGTPFVVGLSAIADAKGFVAGEFKDTPVRLSWTYFVNTGPAINEAIANGQLDFASYGAVPNIIGKARGLPTRILLSYGGTTVFGAARPDPAIRTVADLKGRRIAIQKATIIQWALVQALRRGGLTERDVTIVDLKNADQLAALTAGSVDAAFGSDFLLPLRDRGLANIIYSTQDAGSAGEGFGAILVNEPFQTRYPEATDRVVRGFVRAAAWLADDANRQEAFEIWSRAGTPVAVIAAGRQGAPLKSSYNPRLDPFFLARYQSGIDFDLEQRLIRKSVDLASWVDAGPSERAIDALGLRALWPDRPAPQAAN